MSHVMWCSAVLCYVLTGDGLIVTFVTSRATSRAARRDERRGTCGDTCPDTALRTVTTSYYKYTFSCTMHTCIPSCASAGQRAHRPSARNTTAMTRYMGSTGRLPISPLNDTYLVPEAPQSRVALEYRLIYAGHAHGRDRRRALLLLIRD
eukprot:4556548-Prymnesium_polylepis.1